MSTPIVVGTEALDGLASQLGTAASLAEGAGAADGGTLHPEVAAALKAFQSTWTDRRRELAEQLRKAAAGCQQTSAHAVAIDQAGVSQLRR